MWALPGSGIRVMSDASIPFQPAIEEPSKAYPSANMPSLTHEPSAVTCCILPLVSVKRRSRNFTSLSFIIFSTSPTFLGLSAIATPLSSIERACLRRPRCAIPQPGLGICEPCCSNCVGSGFAGADANGLFDRGNEDLAVADAPGLGGLLDRIQGFGQHVVAEHHLDLHLGQEIHHVLSTAIELGVALLATKSLGLDNGNALQANLLQSLLHLVELEGLDDSLDLFHASRPPPDRAQLGVTPLSGPRIRLSTLRAKVYAA